MNEESHNNLNLSLQENISNQGNNFKKSLCPDFSTTGKFIKFRSSDSCLDLDYLPQQLWLERSDRTAVKNMH